MVERVGQQFGQYRLTRFLGRGSFGEVYLGEHVYKHSLAAVKLLQARLTPEDLKEFINEASATFRLQHPHIVRLLDFGIGPENTPFLTMAYAPNGTLRERHPRGTRLPLDKVVRYVKPIAAALQQAHDERLIHRDVKPENVLLGPNGEIWLSDFGITALAHSSRSIDTEKPGGTLPYMAPEQLQGRPRPASDQYALGIMVYEWLCGVRPYSGTSWEIISQHMSTPPPSLRKRDPTISSEVEHVVLTTLAKDPHQRFASVRAFANALEQASKPQVSLPTTSSSAAPSRPVTTVVTDAPVTSLPAPPALQLPITPAPVPSEPTPANKDTVQFGPPPATPMPSISSIADSHTPPVHPPNNQILSSRSISAPQPVIRAPQQKHSRLSYPILAAALQSAVIAVRQTRSRLLYPTLGVIILLLVALGGGAYYTLRFFNATQSFQQAQALVTQAKGEVQTAPARALEHLASAQSILQALKGSQLGDQAFHLLRGELTTIARQAIQTYNHHAAITPLCPSIASEAPINEGSTNTNPRRLAPVQATSGPALLYALGLDEHLYQLKQLANETSLANLLTLPGNPRVLDITADETQLAVLLTGGIGPGYQLGLLLPGQSQLRTTTVIKPSTGDIPLLVVAQGNDIYVILAPSTGATLPAQRVQVVDVAVNTDNTFKPNPTTTQFQASKQLISVAAFPNHLLFFLLADGSIQSLQLGGTSTSVALTPVSVAAPIAPPLVVGDSDFSQTAVPTVPSAAPSTGPLSIPHADVLAVGQIGGAPHLYIGDPGQHRLLDLTSSSGGGVVGNNSIQGLQVVEQYVSGTQLTQINSIAVNSKEMKVYLLTQNTASTFSLLSISTNGQAQTPCA